MKIIELKKEGIYTETDITLKLAQLFSENPKDTTFVFENGNYYFSPHEEMEYDYRLSNSDRIPVRKLGIWLKNMKNCVLQGNGAKLFFSGHMQPITLDTCENIKVTGFEIDWKKPLVAEGTVVAYDESHIDMYIDPKLYPHRLNNQWLEFDTGNEEWYPLHKGSQIQFDENTGTVRQNSGDKFRPQEIQALGNSIYRFVAKYTDTAIGNVFVLRHNERLHAGIFAEKCKNVLFSDINVYSCGGLGCLAQFCEDMTYQRVHFIPNTKIGRKIANGRDDGMHITCCSGVTTITECTFMGLMDDPINVHSCCVLTEKMMDEKTIQCKYAHNQAFGFYYWAKAGDEIVFIDKKNLSKIATVKVEAYELDGLESFHLVFEEVLPEEVRKRLEKGEVLAVDNLSNTTAFVCTKNRFGSCRARGVLISTPQPVRIEENYFASSGTAILVAGDANYWYESGECHDVEIKNNVFTDACLSSEYQFCEGIISICPEIPVPELDKPFHKNIRIIENVFDTDNKTVVYGFSCLGLTFAGNRIYKSTWTSKTNAAEAAIRLRYCSSVVIKDNCWIGKFDYEKKLLADCCEALESEIRA